MQQEDNELLKTFGSRLKKLRVVKNKSLNQFVLNKGFVTISTLNRVENGLVDFKFTTLVRIANALDITPSELLEGFNFQYEPD